MKADGLLPWEKAELAQQLASEAADAEDLLEAFPVIGRVSSLEASLLDGYIDWNWRFVLAGFGLNDLEDWLEEKEEQEEYDRIMAGCGDGPVEEEYDYAEAVLEYQRLRGTKQTN